MNSKNKAVISVQTTVKASLKQVWEAWTQAEQITQWNFASDDWCCPTATSNFQPNGEFSYRMEAKDGSMGFDFTGTFQNIVDHKFISYTLGDGRQVEIQFEEKGSEVLIKESFEAEDINSEEMQRNGWHAILENFKKFIEEK